MQAGDHKQTDSTQTDRHGQLIIIVKTVFIRSNENLEKNSRNLGKTQPAHKVRNLLTNPAYTLRNQ